MKIMNFTKRLLFLGILFLLFGNTETVFADTIKTPTFSSIENISSTEIKLNFKSNSSCTECGIEILNETTGYFYRVSNAATSYNLKGLTNGKTYKFKISMYYIQSGIYYNSPWSPSKSIKVSAPVVDQPITVNKPSFNKLERIGYNKMKLSYSTSGLTTGVEVYNITTNKKYKTTNKSNFTFSNLTYNKRYEFKLRNYYTLSGKYYYSYYTSAKSIVTNGKFHIFS